MWYQASKKIIIAGKKEVVQILNNDLELYKYIEGLQPKTQSPAAYFIKMGVEPEQVKGIFTKLDRVDKVFPYNVQYTRNGVLFNGQTYTAEHWLRFVEVVDGLNAAMIEKKNVKEQGKQNSWIHKIKERNLPVQQGKINVVKVSNPQEAIKYGQGMSWCIAQPKNNLWQSYRDNQNSTFYFVFDGTRSEEDPLRRVAVDANKRGISLTDVKNTTGRIAEFGRDEDAYMQYLASKGVDIGQFQMEPFSEQELKEKVLAKSVFHLEDFINLPNKYPDIENVYGKYIGRGHSLRDNQLQWLIDHKLNHLVQQYISTGLDSVEMQKEKFIHNNQWMRTYDKMIDIKADSYINMLKTNDIDNFETLGDRDSIIRMVEKGLDPNIIIDFYGAMEQSEDYNGEGYEQRVVRENDPFANNTELIKKLANAGGNLESLWELIDYPTKKINDDLAEFFYEKGVRASYIGMKLSYDSPLLRRIIYETKDSNLINRQLYITKTYNDPELIKWLLLNGGSAKLALGQAGHNYEMEENGQKMTLAGWLHLHNLMPVTETINPAAWEAEYGVKPKPFNLEKQDQQKKEDFIAEHGVRDQEEKDVV